MAAFLESGHLISQPFGENARYDFLAEKEGRFIRVQVKTGWIRDGVVRFNCVSNHYHRGGGDRGYIDEADVFAVYCRSVSTVFCVPVGEVHHRGFLRVTPTINRQTRKIRWAADYVLAKLAPPDLVGLLPADGVAKAGAPPL